MKESFSPDCHYFTQQYNIHGYITQYVPIHYKQFNAYVFDSEDDKNFFFLKLYLNIDKASKKASSNLIEILHKYVSVYINPNCFKKLKNIYIYLSCLTLFHSGQSSTVCEDIYIYHSI